jgi:hypothetical protein
VNTSPSPDGNHILGALPPLERERLFPHLQLMEMPLGKVLYESGAALRHIYFPTDSIVSLLYVMRDGASAEIAAGKIQKLGVIRYARGRIMVLDRPHLERLSCECYQVVRQESDRLLSPPLLRV